MTSSSFPLLLVTGASGHLARQAIAQVLERWPAERLVAATRHPDRLADLAARGVQLRFADFDQPASLTAAFDGAQRLLLVSTDAIDGTPRRVTQHGHAIAAAEAAGVAHLVYTSFAKADSSPLGAIAMDHGRTERLLQDSRLGFTVLRNAFYAEMLLATLPLACRSGTLPCAEGGGGVPYIARADAALAAAAALADGFEGRRTLDIAGEAAIDAQGLAALASEVLGCVVAAVPQPDAALQAAWEAAGAAAPMARLFAAIDRGVAQGAMDVAGPAFRQLTGRAPVALRDFLAQQHEVLTRHRC